MKRFPSFFCAFDNNALYRYSQGWGENHIHYDWDGIYHDTVFTDTTASRRVTR